MSPLVAFDQSVVLSWSQFITTYGIFGFLARFFALYGVYLLMLFYVVWWFLSGKKQRQYLLSSVTAGLLAWQVFDRIIKLFYHHPRPVQILPVQELLFERPENSFPSDHMAFLTGIAIFFLLRKQIKPGLWVLLFALLVGSARIAVAVHYPTDILGGFVSGLILAWLVHLFHDTLSDNLWDRLIRLAHKLHLA